MKLFFTLLILVPALSWANGTTATIILHDGTPIEITDYLPPDCEDIFYDSIDDAVKLSYDTADYMPCPSD